MALKVLILGGTTEATALVRALADDTRFALVLSLAGATRSPRALPVPTRIGGFGGVDGLVRYLEENATDALVVATHPFAAQIRRNAVAAARRKGLPLLIVERPIWQTEPGDSWIRVADADAAAAALGATPRRVLLTIGRKELAPFATRPHHHYIVRTIDPPDGLPESAELVMDRGPYVEADEVRLLKEHRIEMLVSKNSGGNATQPKLLAARTLGVPVVMIDRPPAPDLAGLDAEHAGDAAAALAWLERRHQAPSAERGV
jgi:precorrin-6A/cobalt-precorrin-6A reductase